MLRTRRPPASLPAIGAVALLSLALLTSGGALAQDISTYPTVQHPERYSIDWRSFYERANALTSSVRGRTPHHLDIRYGEHPKQRLDLYLPESAGSTPWPVFVFLHGGGFREGDRAHYGFVAGPLASSGVATVVASYRLHPHRYPDQVEDTRLIVEWVHRNIGTYGGQRDLVFVGGHSAGAILSAHVGVTADWVPRSGLPTHPVRGIVPVSGPYDLRTAGGFVNDFVNGQHERERASPLLRIERVPHAVVALGSREAVFLDDSRRLVEALRARGGQAELVILEGLGHDATALAFGEQGGSLFREVRKMIQSATVSVGGRGWKQ